MTRVSLITACYNSESTIRDTIESVLSQSHENIEYIIVDGASTDSTLSIVNEYSDRISIIVSEPDSGLYAAMNKGIEAAQGDVVGTINSDDVYYDTEVISMIAERFQRSNVQSCYGDLVYVRQNNIDRVVRIWKSCVYSEKLWKTGWVPAHPTFFVRKSVYSKYGGFDLSKTLAADYEILIRLLGKEKISVEYIPKIFVRMRLGGKTNSSLKNIFRQNIEIVMAAKKNGFRFFLPVFLVRKMVIKARQFILAKRTPRGS